MNELWTEARTNSYKLFFLNFDVNKIKIRKLDKKAYLSINFHQRLELRLRGNGENISVKFFR